MKLSRTCLSLVIGFGLVLAVAACTSPTPTPTAVPTEPPTATEASTATALPTETATAVPTTSPTPPRVSHNTTGSTVLTSAKRAAAGASLTADRLEVEAGGCATVRWQVTGATSVKFNGTGVDATGTQQVCPTETTTYALTWVNADGSNGSRSITINASGSALAGAAVSDEDDKDKKKDNPQTGPAPEPSATDCGDDCGVTPGDGFVPLPTSAPPAEPTSAPPEDTPAPPSP